MFQALIKRNIVVVAGFAGLAILAGLAGYRSYVSHSDYQNCLVDRTFWESIISDVELSDLKNVSDIEFFLVGTTPLDPYPDQEQLKSEIAEEIRSRFEIDPQSANTLSFSVDDAAARLIRHPDYGRAGRFINITACKDGDVRSGDCKYANYTFHGPDRDAMCDASQAIEVFFND